jgi:hypothetical protein
VISTRFPLICIITSLTGLQNLQKTNQNWVQATCSISYLIIGFLLIL